MADGSWEELPGNMPCSISPDRADHGAILFTPRRPRGEAPHRRGHPRPPRSVGRGTAPSRACWSWPAIPYVGCGVLASAVCMDKAVANALFAANNIPHCAWAAYTRAQLEADPEGIYSALEAKLGWPIFVKPANAGSSVGISKAANRAELADAIKLALQNDPPRWSSSPL